jgi:hypothetical protein
MTWPPYCGASAAGVCPSPKARGNFDMVVVAHRDHLLWPSIFDGSFWPDIDSTPRCSEPKRGGRRRFANPSSIGGRLRVEGSQGFRPGICEHRRTRRSWVSGTTHRLTD